jgi:hypothetical protein
VQRRAGAEVAVVGKKRTAKARSSARANVEARAAAVGDVHQAEEDPRVPWSGGTLTGAFGVTGLKRSGGRLLEEFHPKLRGHKADKVYREMADNNPLIGAALWLMEALVRQAKWRFEAPKDTGERGQWVADRFNEMKDDMATRWPEFISEAMTMMIFGWFAAELLLKIRRGPSSIPTLNSQYDDGLWAWRDFAPRAQESRDRWDFDAEGNVRGLFQRVETDTKERYIPIEKLMLFRVRSRKGSPEGYSPLRPAYRPWHFCTHEEEIEAVGMQRQLAGLPFVKIPLEAMADDPPPAYKKLRAMAEDLVKKVRADEMAGIVFPTDEDRKGKTGIAFGLLASSGKNVSEASPVIQRWRTDILIALLVPFLQLGSLPSGTRSLASEFTDILGLAVSAILESIADTITSTAVRIVGDLNGWEPEILPYLSFSDVEKQDMLRLAQMIGAASQAGVLTVDDQLETWFREEGGLPEASHTRAAGRGLGALAQLFGGRPAAASTPAPSSAPLAMTLEELQAR